MFEFCMISTEPQCVYLQSTVIFWSERTMESYTWNMADPSLVKQIKSAKRDEIVFSPVFTMFNLRWQLRLYPNRRVDDSTNKSQIFLNLKSLPPNIHSISIQRKYKLMPGGIEHQYDKTLTHDSMTCATWLESHAISARQIIEKYDEYIIKVDVELLTVYDKKNNDITQQYLQTEEEGKVNDNPGVDNNILNQLNSVVMQMKNLDEMFKEMQSQINDIQLRLDEEQKENKTEINAIREFVNELSAKINMDPKRQKLKQWLEEKVGLPQFYDLFIQNGVDDLSTAKLLTAETLKDMGIEKVGEKMKILHQVALLNENKNDEGQGTQYL